MGWLRPCHVNVHVVVWRAARSALTNTRRRPTPFVFRRILHDRLPALRYDSHLRNQRLHAVVMSKVIAWWCLSLDQSSKWGPWRNFRITADLGRIVDLSFSSLSCFNACVKLSDITRWLTSCKVMYTLHEIFNRLNIAIPAAVR